MRRHALETARAAALVVVCTVSTARGSGLDTNRIKGDYARALLGDGTGVVVGIIDSGVDVNHPALSGTVTGGLPRLVAQANFVTSEPSNTGDDAFGHGTAVAGQILSRDAERMAVATDARYVNARVLDSSNGFATDAQIINGVGFALDYGANLLNISLNYGNSNTSGNSRLALLTDYVTFTLRIPITVSAGNNGNTSNRRPQGPADAFNVFSTASTAQATNYGSIRSTSSYGPTSDGRNRPVIAAPGDQVSTALHHSSGFSTRSGTSFAAPTIAGILAAQMEYGAAHNLSIDPLVLKATMLNSAEKVADRNGAAWAPTILNAAGGVLTTTSPLNSSAGAGQVDGLALYDMYAAGEMGPGTVSRRGWDKHTLAGAASADYHIGRLMDGAAITATLTWFRHVAWGDANSDGRLDAGDTFSLAETFDNLDLLLYRDGELFAQSISNVDSVEHLYIPSLAAGDYIVRVARLAGSGGASEEYGVAWSATPEPKCLCAIMMTIGMMLQSRAHRPPKRPPVRSSATSRLRSQLVADDWRKK